MNVVGILAYNARTTDLFEIPFGASSHLPVFLCVGENPARKRGICRFSPPNKYLKIEHVKEHPVVLGDAEVVEFTPPTLSLKRTFYGKGYYDGLDVEKEPKDYAITEIEEGRWYLVHRYYSKDGTLKGSYYNICTPVEIYRDKIRYCDLEIDVVEDIDGNRKVIEEGKLKDAVEEERITKKLGDKALEVAEKLVN